MTQCAVRTALGARVGAGWQWTRDGETMAGTGHLERRMRQAEVDAVAHIRAAGRRT
jgi:hypothetical protein